MPRILCFRAPALCLIAASLFVPSTASAVSLHASDSGLAHARIGDLVSRGHAQVAVPERGETACGIFDVEELRADGTIQREDALCVKHYANDMVGVVDHRTLRPEGSGPLDTAYTDSSAMVLASGTSAECADTTYSMHPWRWNKTMNWHFSTGAMPNIYGSTRADVIDDLKASIQNWKSNRNNCGDARNVTRLSTSYAGLTERNEIVVASNVNNGCGSAGNDVYSDIGFGQLPARFVPDYPGAPFGHYDVTFGATCIRVNASGEVVSSDIRLNNDSLINWGTTGEAHEGNTAVFQLSVENVATHERGHMIGIAHAGGDPVAHPALTMGYGNPNNYSRAATTLGKGDSNALIRKYG